MSLLKVHSTGQYGPLALLKVTAWHLGLLLELSKSVILALSVLWITNHRDCGIHLDHCRGERGAGDYSAWGGIRLSEPFAETFFQWNWMEEIIRIWKIISMLRGSTMLADVVRLSAFRQGALVDWLRGASLVLRPVSQTMILLPFPPTRDIASDFLTGEV